MDYPKIEISPSELDIVVSASGSGLPAFLEAWRSLFQPFHLIIVCETPSPKIPAGFDHSLYGPAEIRAAVGPDLAESLFASGTTAPCRKSFGFLVARKRYVLSVDEDCFPYPGGNDAVQQHMVNLKKPSAPFFFNTLYDPFRKGNDFVRGYPFSLREGAPTAVSHGLCLDRPNQRVVDVVLTIPKSTLFPLSTANLAFDSHIIGPAMFLPPACPGDTHETFSGLCLKAACDHLGLGVKSGLPYVTRNKEPIPITSDSPSNLWLEHAFPFFQTLALPRSALTVEDCYLEIAKLVKTSLSPKDPSFDLLGSSMENWIQSWKKIHSS